jgi:hypothetical protein
VAKDMLQDNEEMLKRNVIRVQLPAKLQAAVNHLQKANPPNLKENTLSYLGNISTLIKKKTKLS